MELLSIICVYLSDSFLPIRIEAIAGISAILFIALFLLLFSRFTIYVVKYTFKIFMLDFLIFIFSFLFLFTFFWMCISGLRIKEIEDKYIVKPFDFTNPDGSKIQMIKLNSEYVNITKDLGFYLPENSSVEVTVYKKDYFGILYDPKKSNIRDTYEIIRSK